MKKLGYIFGDVLLVLLILGIFYSLYYTVFVSWQVALQKYVVFSLVAISLCAVLLVASVIFFIFRGLIKTLFSSLKNIFLELKK